MVGFVRYRMRIAIPPGFGLFFIWRNDNAYAVAVLRYDKRHFRFVLRSLANVCDAVRSCASMVSANAT
jgi:hypothetical protein